MELAVRSSSASLVPTQRLNRYLREIRLTRLFGKLRGELYTLLWEYAEREATKNEKVRLLLLPVVRVHGLGLERHRSHKSWLRRAVAATQIRFSEQRRSFQELSARKSAVGPREIPFAVGKARVNNVRRDASKLGKVFLGARPRRSRKLASRRRTTLFGPFLDACIPGIHRRKRRRYRRLPSSDCVARGPRKHGLECKQASRRWCCCAVSFILTRIFPFCFVCEQCCVSVPPYGVLLCPPEKQNQSGLSSYQVCSVVNAAGGEKVCPVEQQRETSIRRAVPTLPPLERQMGATRAAGKRKAKVKVGLCGSLSSCRCRL